MSVVTLVDLTLELVAWLLNVVAKLFQLWVAVLILFCDCRLFRFGW